MSIIYNLEMIVHKFTENHLEGEWYPEEFMREWREHGTYDSEGFLIMNGKRYCSVCGFEIKNI